MSLEAALEKLEIKDDKNAASTSNVAGMAPEALQNSTPLDVKKQFTSEEFSFDELEKEFIKHCKDYGSEINGDESMRCIEFAFKILFEAGPQIRSEKKKGKGDSGVKFMFPYKDIDSGNLSIHTVFVSTFRNMEYTKELMKLSDKKMVLTFKQAELLACKTLNKVASYLFNLDQSVIFTPLCGAVFSKYDISAMAVALKIEAHELIGTLNASCCSGGQYLEASNMACAISAVMSATKRLTDANLRNSIIKKTVQQYNRKGKQYSDKEFLVFRKYALGGVPPGLDAKTLIETFESIQEATLRARANQCVNTQVPHPETKPHD